VVDAAAPGAPERVDAVQRILDDLGLEPPRRVVLNKIDAADRQVLDELVRRFDATGVSARTGEGLDTLKASLARALEGPHGVALPGDAALAHGLAGVRHGD
jgi:GTP-binding protein HflX